MASTVRFSEHRLTRDRRVAFKRRSMDSEWLAERLAQTDRDRIVISALTEFVGELVPEEGVEPSRGVTPTGF